MTTDEFRATLRPENIDNLPKIYQCWSLWLDRSGNLFDAQGSHYDFAWLHSRTDVEGLKMKGWVRVNVSRPDECVLIEGARPTPAQRRSLGALRFSQELAVVNDDGVTIFESPSQPREE